MVLHLCDTDERQEAEHHDADKALNKWPDVARGKLLKLDQNRLVTCGVYNEGWCNFIINFVICTQIYKNKHSVVHISWSGRFLDGYQMFIGSMLTLFFITYSHTNDFSCIRFPDTYRMSTGSHWYPREDQVNKKANPFEAVFGSPWMPVGHRALAGTQGSPSG